MDVSIKVRSLISRFEQLSTEFAHQAAKIEPKTPATPKTPSISKSASKFFGETPAQPIVSSHKTNLTKLTDIDGEIRQLRTQINSVESNDDLIKALLLLVNLLINLECIDVDGNNNVKNKKIACFKEIQGLKDKLLNNSVSSTSIDVKTPIEEKAIVKDNYDKDLVILEPIKYEASPKKTNPEESIGFKSVSKIKSLFESNDDLSKSTSCISLNNNEEIRMKRNDLGKSDGDIRKSLQTAHFKPLQDIKNMFDTQQSVISNRSSSIASDVETVIPKETIANTDDFDDNTEYDNDAIDKQHTDEITNSINALHVEISYYTDMVAQLEPEEDAVRTEVLQENIADLIIELEKLETYGDATLEFKKGEAFTAIGALKRKLREKIENNNEVTMLKFNDLCVEIKNYQKLVNEVDAFDKVRCEALDEDIKSTLAEINLLQIPTDLGPRKLTSIKNLVGTQKDLQAKMQASALEAQNEVDLKATDEVNLRAVKIADNKRDTFDQMYELTRDEEDNNACIFDATSAMDDIWVEIDVLADLLEGKDELKGKDKRLLELRVKLEGFETYGDDGLEKRKSDGLQTVRIMQMTLDDGNTSS